MAKNQKSYTTEFKQQIVDLHCKAGKGVTEYVSFIQANLDKYTVKQICSALKFPRITYYAALNHVPSKREQ